MTAAARALTPSAPQGPASVVLRNIPWALYGAIRAETEGQRLRLYYLDGTLEIMSPSEIHDESKTLLARLLESWAVEKDVDLRGYGSSTYRDTLETAGLEPDECYKLGRSDGLPSIAIEVDVSAPTGVDKMAIYARLGVPEVWIWSPDARSLTVHQLVGDAYEARSVSALLPELDLVLLGQFVRDGVGQNQTQLVRRYLKTLQTP